MPKNPCLDCRLDNARRQMAANSRTEAGKIVRYAPIGQQSMVVHMDNPKARAKSVPCQKHGGKP